MKKYEELVQDIVSKVCQGVISVKLPSERELADKYELSRFSVRKALAKLEAIGIVKSKVGSGYFVNTSIIGSPLIYNSVTENKFGEISYKKIKLNKRLPTPHEIQVFSIEDDEYLWHIKRLRLIQGKVTQVEETRLPVRIFPKIDEAVIESSLQKHVLSLGLEIDSYLTTYRAINLSKEDADLLGCKRSKSAMNITNRGFLKSGEVFVVSDIIDIDYQCTYHTKFNSESLSYRDQNDRE
ncbi:GntR family transcriptional regulator [Vibrio tubiashii]|uniref:GntR family transcriptional regulator n=1 Tax=Vibrio tubiashii ATCC 19109 TaxID=1051646 RepID=F9T9Q2_9VIBR|nr:GntR family transcriptional regulator [Vibrio tubiashii]AIW14546.1 GntR family transcriptional regulator [Vibrio tubiashii ATCC 19109]EGU51066.1 GntR family transcriptional regulator [Vibrio tubiashii ATCC 19109]EIF04107.1 transcriptional regulator [Vibrio tubiashii NCIMB 1337 = ATCC 19106]